MQETQHYWQPQKETDGVACQSLFEGNEVFGFSSTCFRPLQPAKKALFTPSAVANYEDVN